MKSAKNLFFSLLLNGWSIQQDTIQVQKKKSDVVVDDGYKCGVDGDNDKKKGNKNQ